MKSDNKQSKNNRTPDPHLVALARLLAKAVASELLIDEKSGSNKHGKNVDQIVSDNSNNGDAQ